MNAPSPSRTANLTMANELIGVRVAFLTANEGVERAELVVPWQAVQEAGGIPELLAPAAGRVQTTCQPSAIS